MSIIVTVDGPAASGKSSVSREVARRKGWKWVSTGMFYRGLAYFARVSKVELEEDLLAKLARSNRWSVQMETERTAVYVDNVDVTEKVKADEVSRIASVVSAFPAVRAALLQLQRDCGSNVQGLVAEGRDCGTVVFPKADVKIFMTADPAARAQRRSVELGTKATDEINAQKERDLRDTGRATAPLKMADGAFHVDNSHLSLDEVVDEVMKLLDQALRV